MTDQVTKVAVLGSTGSIGRSTLEVIAASEGRLEVVALSAHRNTQLLAEQAKQTRPRWVVVTDPEAALRSDLADLAPGTELLSGPEAVVEVVGQDEVDVVVSAIVGSAGLQGTWAALDAGKTVALANKESLVVGGPLVTELARQRGAALLPVDSEHGAVFQALQSGRREDVRRVVLTASGGPFRNHTRQQLAEVSVEQALAHPTWDMGPKITVDSATMMNKALEIIEARWLFDLAPEQIGVVVHPQSIVHSMVEFMDGSVIAKLSPPDMKLPIQYALSYPHRWEGVAERLDWTSAMQLEFEPPDPERFPALALGQEVARSGGTAGAVLNGANEAAVAAFLAGELRFSDIVSACEQVLASHNFDSRPSLEQLLLLDQWARQEVLRWVGCLIASGWLDLAMWFAVLKVAIGLGFVIFVHELGHFVVAKLCGVKCEKFYLGFDIGGLKLAKFTWGETEYGIGVLPLGGYVKMLGQEDNPARMREEIERAKEAAEAERGEAIAADAGQPAAAAEPIEPIAEPGADESTSQSADDEQSLRLREAEAALYDPRSYLAKSVPKRMAIISAGVIMNLIFAFVMAVVAFGMGVRQIASGVGQLIPGEAAWQVGMRVGDDLVAVGDKRIEKFRDMQEAISLGDNISEGKQITVERPNHDEPIEFTVMPDSSGLLPRIGIFNPRVTKIGMIIPGSAASRAQPPLELRDKVVAADGQPVTSYAELHAAMALNSDRPLVVEIERPNGKPGEPSSEAAANTERLSVTVPAQPMRRLGLMMQMGKISAVQDGSPAKEAGIEPGDVIRQFDVDLPTALGEAGNPQAPGDPMTFPQRLREYAGKRVRLFVEREGQEELQPIDVTLRLAPWHETPEVPGNPMTVPVLGIAYRVLNRVHAPISGSPAAKAGLAAGDEVTGAKILPPQKQDDTDLDFEQSEAELKFDAKNRNWPSFIFALQRTLPGTTVELTWKSHDAEQQTEEIALYEADDWFNPERGLQFTPLYIVEKGETFGQAVALGWNETVKSTLLVYRFLQKLGAQQVSPRALGGPVSIFIVAKRAAEKSTAELLIFLTLLSANLAVINFLPIPLLDGGHMVLLAYEGIRGKPADERVQIALTYIGLVFILTLMIWVLSLDFGWIPRQ